MREFFRGWRRKVGVVTLVLACVFTGFWVLSLISSNKLVIEFSRTNDFAKSIELRSEGGMMQYVESTELYFGDHDNEVLFAHTYWSIVIPLTLVSLWLLLTKPRKANSETVQPTQTTTSS